MKKYVALIFMGMFLAVPFAHANTLSVAPLLLDLEVQSRDIITKDITVTNTTPAKLFVYATVNEISVDEGGAIKAFVPPVQTDRTETVTSWIEITRGRIELEPHATKTIPLTIRMHPYTKAGLYHVFIGFVPTSKRFQAEAAALAGDAEGVIVKVALEEETNELVRISSFIINRFILTKDQGNITINVENNGDSEAVPSGEIIFYNSRGEEVSSLPVSGDGAVIPAGEKRTITTEVPFDQKLGRYKANLVLRYGNNQHAAVFDTTQFFMIPLPLVIGLATIIILFSLIVTYLIRRSFYNELHEDDEGNEVPLFVRNDREHEVKDHDIHISKNR